MRTIARNVLLTTGSRALDGAVRFLTVPLVLGYFGREDFGLMALAYTIQVFFTLADFGIGVNAVRRLSELLVRREADAMGRLVRAASAAYAAIGLLNLGIAVLVGHMGQRWFDLDERRAEAFFWMMLALGLSSLANWVFAIYRQVLQAANLVGWDEALNLISTVLILVVLAATLHFRWPVATYFMLVLTPPLVPMLLRLWRVRRLVPDVRLGFALDWPTVRPLAGTSAWLFLMTAAEMAANHYRPIVLAQQASLGDVADFRIVQQVAGFATLMMSGLLSALYPAVARLEAAGDSRRVRLALVHGTRTLLWLHVLVLVPMALVAAPLLTLYVGTSFAHLAPALALWLLTLLGYHNAIVSSLVLARGRIAPLALTTLVSALLCLVLSWWLVPRFGLMALVWAYALHAAIQLAVMYLWMVPLAGAGSGWVLLAQVVPQPLVAAGVGALATALLVYGARAPLWLGALVFAAIVAAFALRPGGVLADWRSLKAAA